MSSNKAADKTKKKKEQPDGPLTPKHRKNGKLLLKSVKKFLRYNEDVISDSDTETIAAARKEFVSAMEGESTQRKAYEELGEKLTETCKKSVKDYQPSVMRENVEVFFVAVVIAMGIRAYFGQPFKIPTGSMQPTLNGVIGYSADGENVVTSMNKTIYQVPEGYEKPGVLKRVFDKIWYGRSHVEVVSEEDDFLMVSSLKQKTYFLYFTRTQLSTRNGQTFSIPGTASRVQDLINPKYFSNPVLKKGDVIARGFIDTGDQVIVDKFTYHWKKPERGDVFVFNTRDIAGIQNRFGMEERLGGSQHYIKRLAGVPGDRLSIEPPNLYVGDQLAQEQGFKNVMSEEDRFSGYRDSIPEQWMPLPKNKYFALGDNSANSLDSRSWGYVPGERIVGRAVFVYLPFGHNFGRIQ